MTACLAVVCGSQLLSYPVTYINHPYLKSYLVTHRCIPVPANATCRIKYNFTDYAPAVAERHTAVVSDLQLFNISSVHKENSFCVDLTEWFACTYRFPPCEGFKLLPLCHPDCLLVEASHMKMCLDIFVGAVSRYMLPLEAVSLLSSYNCLNRDKYYEGNFTTPYFTSTNSCYTTLNLSVPG